MKSKKYKLYKVKGQGSESRLDLVVTSAGQDNSASSNNSKTAVQRDHDNLQQLQKQVTEVSLINIRRIRSSCI